MTIADRAYEIMKEGNMSQSAVARKAGIDPKQFNSILRHRKLIREEHVIPICKALKVTPNELFGFPDSKTKNI